VRPRVLLVQSVPNPRGGSRSSVFTLMEDSNLSELTPSQRGQYLNERARDEASVAMDRYAAGDDTAFGEVYDSLAPRLYGYLLRQTRDATRAEDLLQQALLQIHATRGRFLRGADVVPWAFAISRRLLIDSYRRRRREANALDVERPSSPSEPGTDDMLHRKRLITSLEAEVAKLPDAQRVAFELTKREGLSLREVAEILGTTVMAVKLRLHRAHLALKAAAAHEARGDAY
jgi:RNA polymerase sigma-70 factor (ECF subfamily)